MNSLSHLSLRLEFTKLLIKTTLLPLSVVKDFMNICGEELNSQMSTVLKFQWVIEATRKEDLPEHIPRSEDHKLCFEIDTKTRRIGFVVTLR